MNRPLRILHLEDDPDFSGLVGDMLVKEGLEVELSLVSTWDEFETTLANDAFDLILADYSLPSCNGIQALELAREKHPHTPFLLISGTIGEQAAIESLKAGATDYVLKQSTERLVPAVRRAVQEAQERARRKHVETELVRRERYFRTLTENSLDILTILSREGIFVYNSPSTKRVLGYEPQEVAGQSAFAFIHPADLPSVMDGFQRGLANPGLTVTLGFRFRRKDDSWCDLEAVGQNRLEDPEIAGIVVNSRDVSDRKRVEENLRESEQEYRLIFHGNPNPMWVFDLETLAFLEVNEAAIQHYGYSRDEFLGMGLKDIRPTEDSPEQFDYQKELRAERTHTGTERARVWRHRTKSGIIIDAEVKWSPIAFRGRLAALTLAHDVTERTRAEEALAKSEASLTAAQRIAHLGSWELDLLNPDEARGRELRWSDETYRIFGFEPGQVPVTNDFFLQCVHAEDRKRLNEAMTQALRDKGTYDIEHRIILPNGEERVVRERAELTLDTTGKPVQMRGTVMDVTERKRLEEQFRQAQKMEAVGQLAGGVAHDFNNILTVIHGHASLLTAGGDLSEAATKSAQQIGQAAERAAGLTRQLLTFSRRQVMQPRRLDMNEVVSNMTKMLGRILGEDVALQVVYWAQPPMVEADGSMMEQVLLNLAVNSRDAMPKGGQLTVRIGVVVVEADHVWRHPEARTGRFVCLSVADTGCGIAPENLRRIFDPFFTTKEVGKGTGLGLATVYGIVKQHQGWIEVESEPGRGTAFRVYIPSTASGASQSDEKPEEVAVRGGTETILVVEDEHPVRELVCTLLQGRGYRTFQAESGARALDVWRQHKQEVDLLLTDLVMPDRINGRELAEKLWQERPALKVIFTSGYSADVVGKEFVLRRGLNYLEKPYHPQKLALAVRECLDGVTGFPRT